MPYEYFGSVIKVLDADTLKIRIDLGFDKMEFTSNFRIVGIDAYEKSTRKGKEAKKFVEDLFASRGVNVRVKTHKPDKYGGRWLADVFIPDYPAKGMTETSFAELVLSKGYAVKYDGGKRILPKKD